jgi:hypothetical protein
MRLALVIVLCLACGSKEEPRPPEPAPPAAPPEPPLPPTRCSVPRGSELTLGPRPRVESGPPREQRPCRDLGAAGARVIRDMQAGFAPTREPSTLSVELGCDHLGDRVDEVDLVIALPVAWTLTAYRLRRDPGAADRFLVRAISIEQIRATEASYDAHDAATLGFGEATIPAASIDAVLPRVRAALTARATIVPTPRAPGQMREIRVNIGAVHFHTVVRVVDSTGNDLSGRYTGPGHPDAQDDFIGVDHAADLVQELVREVSLSSVAPVQEGGSVVVRPRPASDDDRAFARDVLRADPDLLSNAWPAELYVALVGRLDDPTRIPDVTGLLATLEPTEADLEREPEPPIGARPTRTDDLRIAAVNALAHLSHWDVRRADDGTPRPLDEVAAEYQRECGAAVAAATAE